MSVTLDHICRIIGAECPSQATHEKINGISSIQDAQPDDICFLSNPKYIKHLESTAARAVIVARGTHVSGSSIPLEVDDPYVAFLKILTLFNTRNSDDIASGISPQAVISPDAEIGTGVSIGPLAVIGKQVKVGENSVIGAGTVILAGSKIGRDCILYPNVTIMDNCDIGNRVILHAGAVIGSDGFGFAPYEGRLIKIPQIGRVILEDDVEIGACTCIDRAVFGETIIEKGTKLDNLIQVAHNVRVGSVTVIASQVGISGSTVIGSGVKVGGQAGFAGHLTVGDGASVGARAGVTKDVPPNEIVSGYPAKNHMKAMRLEAALRNLPELIKKVRSQERRIEELEKNIKERS